MSRVSPTARPPIARPSNVAVPARPNTSISVRLPVAALQFVLAHPAVASVIPGAARASEVEDNVASLGVSIPAGFWSDLKSEGLIDKDAPVPA